MKLIKHTIMTYIFSAKALTLEANGAIIQKTI